MEINKIVNGLLCGAHVFNGVRNEILAYLCTERGTSKCKILSR